MGGRGILRIIDKNELSFEREKGKNGEEISKNFGWIDSWIVVVNRTCTLFAVRKNIMFLHRFVLTRNQCPHRSLFFFSQNGIIWENEGRRVVNVGFYP